MVHDNVEAGKNSNTTPSSETERPRRKFLMTASGMAMTAGLLGGYGTFGYMLADFVYPAGAKIKGWLFVCSAESLAQGEALDFATPAGAKVVVARHGAGTTADDYLALSSVCPHLGCRVHWESEDDRFFCPCHNGAFDREGNAVAGPPRAANQSLVRFPLKVESGLLFLETSLESVVAVVDRTERIACAGPAASMSSAEPCLHDIQSQHADSRCSGSNGPDTGQQTHPDTNNSGVA